jgi:prepilin-type N-terminal cleavage/methylation domain-containing protein/prepilin-type processing-associated H-X9-DG protein
MPTLRSANSSEVDMKLRSGYTLIELLVVIAVIALITGILLPVFASARARARQMTCISNLKQIGTANMMYTDDNSGDFFQFSYWSPDYIPPGPPSMCSPSLGDCPTRFWSDILMPYLKNSAVFSCPSDTEGLFDTAGYNLPGNVPVDSDKPAAYRCTYAINEPAFNEDYANLNAPRALTYFDDTASVGLIGDSRYGWSYHSCQRDPDGKYSSYWDQSTGSVWDYGDLIGDVNNAIGSTTHHTGGCNFVFLDGHAKCVPLTIGGTEDTSIPDLYFGYFKGAKMIDRRFDSYSDCDFGSQ